MEKFCAMIDPQKPRNFSTLKDLQYNYGIYFNEAYNYTVTTMIIYEVKSS